MLALLANTALSLARQSTASDSLSLAALPFQPQTGQGFEIPIDPTQYAVFLRERSIDELKVAKQIFDQLKQGGCVEKDSTGIRVFFSDDPSSWWRHVEKLYKARQTFSTEAEAIEEIRKRYVRYPLEQTFKETRMTKAASAQSSELVLNYPCKPKDGWGVFPFPEESLEDTSGHGYDASSMAPIFHTTDHFYRPSWLNLWGWLESRNAVALTPGQAFRIDPNIDLKKISEQGQLTVTAWVRKESPEKFYLSSALPSDAAKKSVWEIACDEKGFYLGNQLICKRNIDAGGWHHVAVTADLAESQEGRVYLDGNLCDKKSLNRNSVTAEMQEGSCGGVALVGQMKINAQNCTIVSQQSGGMSDVRVYRGILKDDDIKKIYNEPAPTPIVAITILGATVALTAATLASIVCCSLVTAASIYCCCPPCHAKKKDQRHKELRDLREPRRAHQEETPSPSGMPCAFFKCCGHLLPEATEQQATEQRVSHHSGRRLNPRDSQV